MQINLNDSANLQNQDSQESLTEDVTQFINEEKTNHQIEGEHKRQATMLDAVQYGNVQIADQETPLVILYGPTTCGKSMTLIRLSQYLQKQGRYTISPDRSFRDAMDQLYRRGCDAFPMLINNPTAVVPDGTTDYMLVDVFDNKSGRTICKILEAPGELYFDPYNPDKEYPHYLNTIINASNRKVWCIITEPTPTIQSLYVGRIRELKPRLRPGKDQVIILFHKVDLKPEFIVYPGVVRQPAVIKYINDYYPGLFNIFLNPIPIVNIFKKYDCYLIPFSAGDFSMRNGKLTHQPGVDEYPEKLWNTIRKSI